MQSLLKFHGIIFKIFRSSITSSANKFSIFAQVDYEIVITFEDLFR